MSPTSVLKEMTFTRGRSAPPLYRQFAEAVREAIREGLLAPGDRLPPTGKCAELASLSLGTVHHGMAELQDAGEIVCRQRAGTFIADSRHRQSEIIICGTDAMANQFQSHLIESFDGDRDERSEQRVFTCLSRVKYVPRNLLRLVRQRRPEAVIAYRPHPDSFAAFRAVSQSVPVISLVNRIPDAEADAVCIDAYDPTCHALRGYLERGHARFAFVSSLALLDNKTVTTGMRSDSPYIHMAQACLSILSDAGAELEMVVRDSPYDAWRAGEAAAKQALSLPDETVLITASPHILLKLRESGCRAPMLTYTESEASWRQCAPLADVLYQSMSLIAEEAVSSVNAAAGRTTGRLVTLKPRLYSRRPTRNG